MHLISIATDDGPSTAILDRERGDVIDLSRAAPRLPRAMAALIRLGAAAQSDLRAALAGDRGRRPLAGTRLMAPLPYPVRNVICVGKNYRDHVAELRGGVTGGAAPPAVPIFFTKATTAVIGPGEPVPAGLDPTGSVDYEGELGVVIGPGGRGIAPERAMGHVYGYTIINDVTSRRLQAEHGQWFLGKSSDGFCPMGPAIVTTDAVPDVSVLRVQTRVNGELRQDGRVADLIFDIPTLIATLSRTMTLEPGDVIATGTPAGVGMGFTPPRYLAPGDRVAVTIDPIGTLENPIV